MYNSYDSGVTGFMIFLYIVFIVAFIVISWKLAKKFQEYAEEKGHTEHLKAIFWLCFFFGVIFYIVVAAMPDRSAKARAEGLNKKLDELIAAQKETQEKIRKANLANGAAVNNDDFTLPTL